MLDQYDVSPTLPASDIERAKAWYRDKLGFSPEEELPDGSAYSRTPRWGGTSTTSTRSWTSSGAVGWCSRSTTSPA